MKLARIAGAACFLLFAAAGGFANSEAPQNHVTEITFTSSKPYADPFNEVDLDVIFTAPGGAEARVPAFWAGGRTWRVRYASLEVGEHHFTTICSDRANQSLHGVKGVVTLSRYA